MDDSRIKKTFRLTLEVVRHLEAIAGKLNVTETEALARAITHYYLTLSGEEEAAIRGGLVPLSVYQSTQEKLERLLYRVGELEGTLKAKEELIQELRAQLDRKSKPWWKRWL